MTELWTNLHPEPIPNLAFQTTTQQGHALGTNITLTIYGAHDSQVLEASFDLINYYEDLFTVNRPDSEVMAINKQAGLAPVQVSTPVYNLVKLAVMESRQNFGFNTAIGPLVKLWKIGFDDAKVPSPGEIAAKKVLINPHAIQLDDLNQTVFLTQKGMELDLGAIAKGYIADRIQDLWLAHGITAGIINLGGNLLMVGNPPHRSDGLWRIGVQDPFAQRGQNIATVALGPCSAVTSGIYERHLETNDGHSYHHILDPQTGYPHENDLAGVTVFTKKSVIAEIETTRLFFTNADLTAWKQRKRDVYGAIFVTKDRKIRALGFKPEDIYIVDPSYQFEI